MLEERPGMMQEPIKRRAKKVKKKVSWLEEL